ncbi:MAG TPA: EAL domain-containing protein [Chloroflexota bacterium]|nr:EAL domain-containing protein [Chloroflexota bacterium]
MHDSGGETRSEPGGESAAAGGAAADAALGFNLLFAHHPLPMWVYDTATLRFLEVNAAAVEHYGYTRDEFLSMRVTDIRPPEEIPRLMRALELVRPDMQRTSLWRHRTRDGRNIDVEVTSHVVAIEGRRAVLVVAQDITERRKAEEELRRSEEQYRQLFENAHDIVFTLDFKGNVLSVNRAGQELTGYTENDIGWLNIRHLLPPEQLSQALSLMREKPAGGAASSTELELLARDGTRVPVELNAHVIHRGGRPVGVQGIARDVRARRRLEERLRFQALNDPLTGLGSRTLLQERLEEMLLRARNLHEPVALLLMDLDRFKEVNDTFGHHYGDAMLRQLGARLMQVVRKCDTIARLGGDEFAAILPGTDARGAIAVADKLLATLVDPFAVEGYHLSVSGSVGIALFPSHGMEATTLLRLADVAMYNAKRARSGYAVYDVEQDQYSPDRLTLVGDLRHAIEHGELVLHYQPMVDLRTGETSRVEALVRWNHPVRGLVPPFQFVSLAEETGLIEPLTLWVAREAFRQCYTWRKARRNITVSINLSAQSLYDPLLVDFLSRRMRESGVSPAWLEVEITESAIMVDSSRSRDLLHRLHAMGVSISIDDFGTGYSSLAYLKELPVDEIKIDRSFVSGMPTDVNDAVIVRSVIDLGHNLGLDVVAEGVEDQHALRMLTDMGCDRAQGFYLGPPMTVHQLDCWFRGEGRSRAAG